MADMVTRCPECSTAFRITPAQLKTAKGAVRCGSCLHIFKALDHLVSGQPSASAKASAKRKTTAKQAAARKTAAAAQAKKASAKNQPKAKPAQVAAKGRLLFDQTAIDSGQADLPNSPDDDLLIDDKMEAAGSSNTTSFGTEKTSVGGELSDSFLELDSWNPEATSSSLFDVKAKEDEYSGSNEHADESWAVDMLDEMESEEDAPEPQRDFSHKNTGSFDAITDEDIDDFLDKAPGIVDEPMSASSDDSFDPSMDDPRALFADEDDPSDRQSLLKRIEPAPVEMNWERHSGVWHTRLLWAGPSLLAIIALFAQIAYFKFDHFSRIDPYRSVYAAICPTLGCELPGLIDARQIRSYNLVVRSHPRVDKALMVDTILLNSASFEQPFPDLVLNFTNLDGKLVAARRFKPIEYLAGELAGRKFMPSGQPVHLALEIADPGKDAVNYSAHIAD